MAAIRGIVVVLIGISVTSAMPSSAAAISGKQPLAVVLCKFTDKTDEPHPVSFYQDMFSETGAGKQGVFDYWKDVSYGKLDLTGTVVKGWYTVPKTLAEWNAMNANAKIDLCASQATGVDFNKFAGVVVLTNQTGLQEDLKGAGPPTTIGGTTYNSLGRMLSEQDQQFNGILHESGHAFGLNHSRTLSQQPGNTDYGDLYDVMSCLGCTGTSSPWGLNGLAGPGLNAIQLDNAGWIDANRELTNFDNSSCKQQTIQMAALNHPEASGYLEARIPAVVPINKTFNSTTADYYTVELRDSSGWDAGIGQDVVLLHLHGQDGYSYWVDISTAGAYHKITFSGESNGLYAGEEYVDAARNAYVAVNAIDASAHTATLTLGACKIAADIRYSGDTQANFGDTSKLAAELTVHGSNAPMPGKLVMLSVGSDSCLATTDSTGHASCDVNVDQKPGSYTASASFAGDATYNSASGSVDFTITKEESAVFYTGAVTSDYHDPFTASAKLVDPDGDGPIVGEAVTFTLGSGDTCSAVTDSSGAASCSINPSQAAGIVDIVASFNGDDYYVSSTDKQSFAITKEETTTAYVGPTVVLQGASGVALRAQLLEDGTTAQAPFGQMLTLSLGGQTCTAVTDKNGIATCTLTFTGALGSEPLTADFAGDAYYKPSSDTGKTAIVFAFPSRGAFVLGDRTVASAGALTKVTWWGAQWSGQNSLSGGAAPPAFKGFAESVATLPTSSPPASCQGTSTSSPGNSPPPTSSVPSYMGVIVASSVTKSGSTIAGNFGKIVVVKTDPGYAPNPGHPGTGTIVATFCP
jgi:M6 family metalloprotease-like protein